MSQYIVTGNSSGLPRWLSQRSEISFMGDSVDETKVSIYVNGVRANINDVIVLKDDKVSIERA